VVRNAGVLAPRVSERRSVDDLEALAVRDLAAALITEKVCHRVLDLLTRHGSGRVDELMMEVDFANHMTRLQRVAETRTAIQAALDTAGRALEVPVWAIKGLSARGWYSEPALRDVGDIDLMVAGVDEAWRLAAVVRGWGYTFERKELPWLKRWLDDESLYGQINLKAVKLYALPNIDIHFGGYSVRHCGLHRLRPREVGSGLSCLGRQDNIPLLVGNAAGDHRITTKDVNDILRCLDGDEVNWEEVFAELGRVALVPFFTVMLRRVKEACTLTASQQEKVESMLARSRPEWPQPGVHRGWERRWLTTVTHAFRLGVRHSPRRAIAAALSACRYYWRPLRLTVKGRRGWPPPRMPALNPWTCVRLVPVELMERLMTESDHAPLGPTRLRVTGPREAISAELSVVRLREGDIVRSKIGDFVPTVHYTLDRRLMARVDARRRDGREGHENGSIPFDFAGSGG
jgi:hypothetical protein